jgi:AraC-like DNA-binding protein
MFILSSIVFFYFRSKVKRLKQLDQEKSIPNQNIEEQIIENEGEAKYKMNQIENYIIENIEDINVDKLREDSGLSKNMFYRVFSRYYDITPKRLINQLKDERFRVKRKNQKNFHNRT